jgi:hypothetical protein
MTYQQITAYLCAWDKRNPHYEEPDPDDGPIEDPCGCGNCASGATELASALIDLRDRVSIGDTSRLHIVIPEGWRLVEPEEVIQRGDKLACMTDLTWYDAFAEGHVGHTSHGETVIRKL